MGIVPNYSQNLPIRMPGVDEFYRNQGTASAQDRKARSPRLVTGGRISAVHRSDPSMPRFDWLEIVSLVAYRGRDFPVQV